MVADQKSWRPQAGVKEPKCQSNCRFQCPIDSPQLIETNAAATESVTVISSFYPRLPSPLRLCFPFPQLCFLTSHRSSSWFWWNRWLGQSYAITISWENHHREKKEEKDKKKTGKIEIKRREESQKTYAERIPWKDLSFPTPIDNLLESTRLVKNWSHFLFAIVLLRHDTVFPDDFIRAFASAVRFNFVSIGSFWFFLSRFKPLLFDFLSHLSFFLFFFLGFFRLFFFLFWNVWTRTVKLLSIIRFEMTLPPPPAPLPPHSFLLDSDYSFNWRGILKHYIGAFGRSYFNFKTVGAELLKHSVLSFSFGGHSVRLIKTCDLFNLGPKFQSAVGHSSISLQKRFQSDSSPMRNWNFATVRPQLVNASKHQATRFSVKHQKATPFSARHFGALPTNIFVTHNHTHSHTYILIYIYTCVYIYKCVCVCVFILLLLWLFFCGRVEQAKTNFSPFSSSSSSSSVQKKYKQDSNNNSSEIKMRKRPCCRDSVKPTCVISIIWHSNRMVEIWGGRASTQLNRNTWGKTTKKNKQKKS